MNFHTVFTQFWLFQPFLGQFQHVGNQKVCDLADKIIGDTGRGRRPPKGAEGPRKEAEGRRRPPSNAPKHSSCYDFS